MIGRVLAAGLVFGAPLALPAAARAQEFGAEKAVLHHLEPGEETTLAPEALLAHGQLLFSAKWTVQDGMGRPLSKGIGTPLSDLNDPLVFPRNFNRISSPEATSCGGCHGDPRLGGGGEFMTNAFVLAERFDFATFDPLDAIHTKGSKDESGQAVEQETIGNVRSTLSLFGSGYVELLSRQMTSDLRALRNTLLPSTEVELVSKGVHFGKLSRDVGGNWITSAVVGLPQLSLATSGPADPPSLVLLPFSHAGVTVSLRAFTIAAFDHHIGIQAQERFEPDPDPDGDGVDDELTRGDVTAATLFQAALPTPGRVIPKDKNLQLGVRNGEEKFVAVGCAHCHVPCLPLDDDGWIFSEPSPFNPAGTLQEGDAYHSEFGSVLLDISAKNKKLAKPRPKAIEGRIEVFLFSDLKLHDITGGPADPNREPLDMTQNPGSPDFFAGNATFITPRLWGVASTSPYFHHGKFTTIREAIESHHGEAQSARDAFHALTISDQDSIIEFLKTLQILPEDAPSLTVGWNGKKLPWPHFPWECGADVGD